MGLGQLNQANLHPARHELDSRIVRMFYTVGFRLTLQGIHIIVVPIHMLLPITQTYYIISHKIT